MKILKLILILTLIVGAAFVVFVDYDKPMDADSVDLDSVEDFVKDVADEAEDMIETAIDFGEDL